MGKRVLLYWLCLLILKNATASVVWDFGTDVEGSSVVAQISGVSVWDKNTNITLPVPTCMEIKYVRVEVTNNLTTPEVTYNKDTHTVHISYKLLQLSISRYEVVAKGKRSRQCGGEKGARNYRRNGVGGGHNRRSSYEHSDSPEITDQSEKPDNVYHLEIAPSYHHHSHKQHKPPRKKGKGRKHKLLGNGNGSKNRKYPCQSLASNSPTAPRKLCTFCPPFGRHRIIGDMY